MADFQVVIEGRGAVAAAKELQKQLAKIGVTGTMEVADEETRRAEPNIKAIILSCVLNFTPQVGAAVVADQITDFIEKHKNSRCENPIERVLVTNPNKDDNNRVLIDNQSSSKQNTVEKIRRVLEDEEDY